MTTVRQACARVASLFRKRELEREFDDELAAHLEIATQDYLLQGKSLAEAGRLARIKLGGIQSSKELHRESRGLPWLEGVAQDLRYAWRAMRRSPGFTVVAVLSLALGIGANTAIFTLIESTLLRPIQVKHPERLRLLTWRERWGGWVPPNLGYLSSTFGTLYEQHETADGGLMHADFSPPLYQEFQRRNAVFDPLFAFKELGRSTVVVDGNAETVNCFLVSGDFYRGMEVTPVIGRAIAPENDVRTQESRVALISYEYWTRRFARSPAAIGKTIVLNEVSLTVIGVNPEYFTGIEPGGHFEIWAPLNLAPAVSGRPWLDDRNQWQIPMMGRLKSGVADAQAQSQLDAIFQAAVDANPGPIAPLLNDPEKRPRFILQSAARGVDYLNDRYGRPLLALLSLAGLVLLIACANVANLLLAKSALRQREISLRLALGARRRRIIRQLLTEGLLLASMAGAAGVVFGYWTRNSVPALLATPWRPSPFDTAFDPKVLLVSLGITLATGVLFSLAPVWQSRRVQVNDALKDGSRGSAGLSKLRIGRLLVALQVALSVLLLAGAGLCVKTFTNLRNIPLGFKSDGVMLFTLYPPRLRYPADRVGPLLMHLQEGIMAAPGVQSATYSTNPMLSSRALSAMVAPGSQKPEPVRVNTVQYDGVGSRFFETMGIPILYGRAIDGHDVSNGSSAAVVNLELARRFFQTENPVGRRFTDNSGVTFEVAGVSGDARLNELREPDGPAFYSTQVETQRNGVTFEVKIAGDEVSAMNRIREAVRTADSDLSITDVRTQKQQNEDGLSQERLLASLAAVFGLLAMTLACIGIYGVMAYAVARRTNEIGIRMALGARPGKLAWMVLRETLWLAGAGVAIGVPVAMSLTPVLDRVLAPGWRDTFAFGTKPNDPSIIAAAVLMLAGAVAMAGYLPARRAARVDPMTALRHE